MIQNWHIIVEGNTQMLLVKSAQSGSIKASKALTNAQSGSRLPILPILANNAENYSSSKEVDAFDGAQDVSKAKSSSVHYDHYIIISCSRFSGTEKAKRQLNGRNRGWNMIANLFWFINATLKILYQTAN